MATDALITFKAGQCDVNVCLTPVTMFRRLSELMRIVGQEGQA